MLKRVVMFVAFSLALCGAYLAGLSKPATVHADATVVVPHSYGAFKGVYKDGYLVFEDGQQTLRIVGLGGDSRPVIVVQRSNE